MAFLIPTVGAQSIDTDTDLLSQDTPARDLALDPAGTRIDGSVMHRVSAIADLPLPMEGIASGVKDLTGMTHHQLDPITELLGDPTYGLLGQVPFQPPRNLSLQIVNESAVRLTWDEPFSSGVTAYRIYRVDLPNTGALPLEMATPENTDLPYKRIAQVPAGTTDHLDTEADLSHEQYVYYVTAVYGLTAPVHEALLANPGPEPDLSALPTLSPSGDVESLPGMFASTLNTFGTCDWLVPRDIPQLPALPDPPFFDIHPECLPSGLPPLMVSSPDGTPIVWVG